MKYHSWPVIVEVVKVVVKAVGRSKVHTQTGWVMMINRWFNKYFDIRNDD